MILAYTLRYTKFWAWLQHAEQDLLFVDDTFYRGRTFYTAGILARLLSRNNKWKFLTLTADRVGRLAMHPRLVILNRSLLYPYENSVATEMGYWDLLGNQYIWRDLIKYSGLLSKEVADTSIDPRAVRSAWRHMMAAGLSSLRHQPDSKETVLALFEIALACAAEGKNIDVAALQDQRAWGLGYSAAFANVMLYWIAQEEPRWKRQRYKNWIAKMLQQMEIIIERHPGSDALLGYYRAHRTALEYTLLEEFMRVSSE